MAVSGIGKLTTNVVGAAKDVVGDVIGSGVYPETEYGLASLLFERILQVERENEELLRDRAYMLTLMASCLETVRAK